MITVMFPCNRNKVWLTCDWNCHLKRPGYKAQYAGTDYAGPEQPLNPSQYNGKVLQAMLSSVGYGYTTFVEHYDPQGNAVLRIRNAHQKNLYVNTGDIVNPKDTLGIMDSTGNSTGTHTHWEVWIKINGLWQNIDPLNSKFNVVIVGDQSVLIPLDGSEPPPIPIFVLPETKLPIVKNITPYRIRLRTLPEVSYKALIINYVQPNSEWEYCGSRTDNKGNVWYAIKKGDKLGWCAAQYNRENWLVPIEYLTQLKSVPVKNTTHYSINIRTYPFVSINARKIGLLKPGEEINCYGYKIDTLGNVWFAVKKNDLIGWTAAKYNGEDWILPIE